MSSMKNRKKNWETTATTSRQEKNQRKGHKDKDRYRRKEVFEIKVLPIPIEEFDLSSPTAKDLLKLFVLLKFHINKINNKDSAILSFMKYEKKNHVKCGKIGWKTKHECDNGIQRSKIHKKPNSVTV